MGPAEGAPQALSHKEMGAALTLHRVSRLEKKGTREAPLTPPLSLTHQRRGRALPLHLHEPDRSRAAIIPRQKGLLLERRPVGAELLSAWREDEGPAYQSAVPEGGPGGLSHIHLLQRAAFGAM